MKYHHSLRYILMLILSAAFTLPSRGESDTGSTTALASPRGIQCITWRYNEINKNRWVESMDAILSFDHIAGITHYITWSSLEPRPGDIQWSVIDSALEQAKKHDKKIAIGILAQARSPQWIYDQAETFSFIHPHPSIGSTTSPIPWDPTYKKSLRQLMTKIAERYDGHPQILWMKMTGPSSLFGVEINFPLRSIDELNRQKLGFTNQRFVEEWKEAVDFYIDVFQETDLALGLHNHVDVLATGGEHAVVGMTESIRDHAIARQKQINDKELVVRLLGLGGKNKKYFYGPYEGDETILTPYLHLFWDVKESTRVGFEANRIFSKFQHKDRPDISPEEFGTIMKTALSYDPDWIEVKFLDVLNPNTLEPYAPYVDALRAAANELK